MQIKLQMVKVTVGYLTNSVEVWEEWKLQIKVDSNVVATESEDSTSCAAPAPAPTQPLPLPHPTQLNQAPPHAPFRRRFQNPERLAHRAALTEMLDTAATKIADYVASPNVRPIPRIVKSGPGPSPLPFRVCAHARAPHARSYCVLTRAFVRHPPSAF